jgi:glycine/D-amino acid oxidase-like deaminating enzyme
VTTKLSDPQPKTSPRTAGGKPASADFVVVGGGIMGLHVAWRLAEKRAGSVVLFEQRRFGHGSSGKSGAILRQHYSHETLIRMARASLAEYAELDASLRAATGTGIGFRRPGMLFLAHPRDRENLEGNVAVQRSCGVGVDLLDATGLRRLEPRARFEDSLVGAFEREAGFVDPGLTLPAIAAQARAAGATLFEGARVADVEVDAARRVQGVVLADGARVATRMLVNCGGPWAALLMQRLGLELPLRVVRPEQAFFAPPSEFGVEQRICADLPNGTYWKSEASGLTRVGLLSFAHDAPVEDPDDYDEGASGRFLADCRARLARRVPAYADATCWGGCGALYTVTPDAQALIGPVEGIEGLFVVSGFSGHGFKLGPSVGRGVAALLLGGDPAPLDPRFFSPRRFKEGRKNAAAYDYGVLG